MIAFNRLDILKANWVFCIKYGTNQYALLERFKRIKFSPTLFLTERGEVALSENGWQILKEKEKLMSKRPRKDAVVVDIDGTLALMKGRRDPFEWEKVGLDAPNTPVVELVRLLANSFSILVVSGRDGSCRGLTEEWLMDNDIPFDQLFMRPAGNCEKDSVIKEAIFHRFIDPMFNVKFVLDDRNQTVSKWRELGLTCLQVAEGDF